MQTPGALHAVPVYVVVVLMLPEQLDVTPPAHGAPVHDQLVGLPPPVQPILREIAEPAATALPGAPEIVHPVGATGVLDQFTVSVRWLSGPLALDAVSVYCTLPALPGPTSEQLDALCPELQELPAPTPPPQVQLVAAGEQVALRLIAVPIVPLVGPLIEHVGGPLTTHVSVLEAES
jgi:hypothetical protein